MSICEIDDQTYESILNDEIARQIEHGLDLMAARCVATEIMRHCFRSTTTAENYDCDLDRSEQAERWGLTLARYNRQYK